MATDRFTDQMQAYGHWRSEITQSIEKYQKWLENNQMSSAEVEIRIYELIETLKSDHLTIAFVAEFARGKTELINAIFFSEYDRRLLPSEAGRTTMCPTELFYDAKANESYIRLLPIETRLEEMSLQEHKLNPINWTSITLDTSSSDKMAEAFQEVIKTKRVPLPVAEKLGLSDYRENESDTMVDIPMWRHALISFPNPLLKEGLTILDTPGLNALGNEPELTISMLPSAQAVVFVLAADTGVTKSDLEMWTQNVQPLGGDAKHGRIVVLNKIDTLWDELKDDNAINASITTQCKSAAKMLNIGIDNVFPVSAQKGLLAKIRHDTELLAKSNILALESILAKDILPQKQQIVRNSIISEIGDMTKESRNLISSRLDDTNKQLKELQGLSGKNEDVITHLMKKTREEQTIYHKNVESFQVNKKSFSGQHKILMQTLSLTQLDALMEKTRQEMTGTWTTGGLKGGMKEFFNIISTTITTASQQADKVNMLLQTIYRAFNKEHGLTDVKPKLFSMGKYRRDLERLTHEADAYRSSAKMAATEQSFVVKKFFISMVSHARNTFFQAHQEVDAWGKAGMAPLVARIKEHRNQMEKRLESLRKINESRDTLQTRVSELEKNAAALNVQLADLNKLIETLNRPLEDFTSSTQVA
jgi:predicted  nucleic acid-binding Zn-ribbon protein